MHIYIIDFEKGQRIEGFYMIRSLNLRTSSNNKKYLDLQLADSTAEINAKIWDVDEVLEEELELGDIIKVRGDVTLWNDELQFKIIQTRPIREGDEFDYSAIVASAPIKPQEMYDYIHSEVEGMKDEDYKKLALHLLEVNKEKLFYYPAAMRNHHAIRSGLLYHLLRMMKSAKVLCPIYELNYDFLLTGILIHDIDKLREMNSNDLGIVSGYTTEGVLLGHIVTGITLIHELGKELELPREKTMLLEHMILSHHYEAEYGSPKKPMFPEAELLHHLDIIDARLYDMKKALLTTKPGEFSEPVFSLDRRKVYREKE
ncbi:3'-5' exoribonuclease YhaM family protein [Guggenheimella bovis]